MAAITLARQGRWLAAQIFVSVVCLGSLVAEEPPKKVTPTPTSGPAGLPAEFKTATGKLSLLVETKVLKAGAFADAGEQDATRKFFELHVKGLFDPGVMPALGKLRQNLRADMIIAGNAPSQAVHVFLRQYLFDECKKLVADEKQPMPTRVNALGIIGDLNQKEVSPAPPNPPATPPQALAAATPYLLGVFEDTKMPSALRVVALRGLLRHAQLGLPNKADVPAVETAMLTAVQATNVPMDCSEPAHEWMRRRAVEILGLLKSPNAAQVMIDIVADANLSLAFRCEAARALGQLTLKQGDPAVGNAAAAQRLGELAATVAETETDRRALHDYLLCVKLGISGTGKTAGGGIRAATPKDDAKLADDLYARLWPVVANVDPNNRKLKDEEVAGAVEELAQRLREILPAPAPAKAKPKTPESAKGKEAKTAEPAKAKAEKAKAAKPAPE